MREGGRSTLGDRFDRTLLAARRGRERAWSALYRDLAPVVLGYLRGRGFPDPEDTCGEVFLEVVRDLHRFQGDERAFRSWVLAIAHHRGLDAARRRRRRPVDPVDPVGTPVLQVGGVSASSAEAEAVASLITDDTLALLEHLTPDQREALVLRLVGGLTAAEIATITGRSRDAVKSLQKRAIAELRDQLGARTPDVAQVADHRATPTSPRGR